MSAPERVWIQFDDDGVPQLVTTEEAYKWDGDLEYALVSTSQKAEGSPDAEKAREALWTLYAGPPFTESPTVTKRVVLDFIDAAEAERARTDKELRDIVALQVHTTEARMRVAEAENARLREALEEIASGIHASSYTTKIARRALNPEEEA